MSEFFLPLGKPQAIAYWVGGLLMTGCVCLGSGTPLQNDLMELWSLMHFLMPQIFASHAQFKDWFNNPLVGMVEGQQEVNKVLNPGSSCLSYHPECMLYASSFL